MIQNGQVRFLQIPRWLAVLVGVAAIAFAVALFLLSLTVFLILLPVIAVASGLYYLFGRRRVAQPRGQGHVEIIEGEYRVIEPERIDRPRDPRS
jgi:membrane protein implicated in regulation of membrane protease activity